jgi:hypothetical protein
MYHTGDRFVLLTITKVPLHWNVSISVSGPIYHGTLTIICIAEKPRVVSKIYLLRDGGAHFIHRSQTAIYIYIYIYIYIHRI